MFHHDEEIDGLLKRIIATIKASSELRQSISDGDNDDARAKTDQFIIQQSEEQKEALQSQFKASDQRLEKLVLRKEKELNRISELYTNVSSRLSESKSSCKHVKNQLVSCKELLNNKRDDLKRLWLEGVEQMHTIAILKRIEELKSMPEIFDKYMNDHNFLDAAKILSHSIDQLEGRERVGEECEDDPHFDLSNIDALSELKMVAKSKRDVFFERILSDMRHRIYSVVQFGMISDIFGMNESMTEVVEFRLTRTEFANLSFDVLFKEDFDDLLGDDALSRKLDSVVILEWPESLTPSVDDQQSTLNRIINDVELANSIITNKSSEFSENSYSSSTKISRSLFHLICVNFAHISINMNCLHQLNLIDDAMSILSDEESRNVGHVISRTSHLFSSRLIQRESQKDASTHLLSPFFTTLINQLVSVANISRVVQMHSKYCRISIPFGRDVWSHIQSALQVMLTSYLDFGSHTSPTHFSLTMSNHSTPNRGPVIMRHLSDINSYFVRRGGLLANTMANNSINPGLDLASVAGSSSSGGGFFDDLFSSTTATTSTNTAMSEGNLLFRFEDSLAALSLAESGNSTSPSPHKRVGGVDKSIPDESAGELICEATPHNITFIYPSLMDLIDIIEVETSGTNRKHCSLYEFLMDYIKDIFLGQLRADNSRKLNEASTLLDSWSLMTDIDVLTSTYGRSKPLLQSTICITDVIQNLSSFVTSLPLYSNHFLNMMCTLIVQYKEICSSAYGGLVQQSPDNAVNVLTTENFSQTHTNILLSAQWFETEPDLISFIVKLPSWSSKSNKKEGNSITFSTPEFITDLILQKLIDLKNNSELVSERHIFKSISHFKSMVLLQQSLKWFSEFTTNLAVVKLPRTEGKNSVQTQTTVTTFKDFSVDLLLNLQDISANKCLIFLYLEIRLHIYHHFQSLMFDGSVGASFAGGQESTEPTSDIIKLSKQLLSIDRSAVSFASQSSTDTFFLYSGLAQFVSECFYRSARNVRRINKNGVHKIHRNIFVLQQTLASIDANAMTATLGTSSKHHDPLEKVKLYYSTCLSRPQDILDSMSERGLQFTLDQYEEMFQLIHRSDVSSGQQSGVFHSGSGAGAVESVKRYMDKVHSIYKRGGIAV